MRGSPRIAYDSSVYIYESRVTSGCLSTLYWLCVCGRGGGCVPCQSFKQYKRVRVEMISRHIQLRYII